MTQPSQASGEQNENPILEYARSQEKSGKIIEWVLDRGLGKPVYQKEKEAPVGVIIPLGKGVQDRTEKAFIYGTDNSLVEVVLDSKTKPIIEPNSQDLIMLPPEVHGGIAMSVADIVSEAIKDEPWQFFNISKDVQYEPEEILPSWVEFFKAHI